ncbi:MAG: lipocalin family protein [Flavobacteriaceae bacterium]|jgi:hypothetical protein|nr:lipocalin family protein [Flavobacteriaceae bacterium]
MKRFLLGLVAVTMFLSCSSDDSSDSSGSIYGVWEHRKTGQMVGDNVVLEDIQIHANCTEYDKIVYSENGVVTTFEYIGYLGSSCYSNDYDDIFTYENGVITYIDDEDPDYVIEYHIIELTNTTMMYKHQYYQYGVGMIWLVDYFVRAN